MMSFAEQQNRVQTAQLQSGKDQPKKQFPFFKECGKLEIKQIKELSKKSRKARKT